MSVSHGILAESKKYALDDGNVCRGIYDAEAVRVHTMERMHCFGAYVLSITLNDVHKITLT